MDRLFPPVEQRTREFIDHVLSLDSHGIDEAEKARWPALRKDVRLKIPLQQSTSNIADSIVSMIETKSS
jgi:hypothetical protein